MSLPRIQYHGAFYHVYSRGVEKRDIFCDDYDYERFLRLMAACHEKYAYVCYAYCLMPNHYHLFLQTPEANLSAMMQWLNARYARYFNLRRDRVGALFQGRFQTELVEKESYGLELSRYIHLNPVRSHLVEKPEDWNWSSLKHYRNVSKNVDFINTNWLLEQFQNNFDNFYSFTVGKTLL